MVPFYGVPMTKNEAVVAAIARKKVLLTASRRNNMWLEIRIMMEKKGLSNKDMAERLGIYEATLWHMLHRQQNMQLDTMYKFADALETKLVITFRDPCEF